MCVADNIFLIYLANSIVLGKNCPLTWSMYMLYTTIRVARSLDLKIKSCWEGGTKITLLSTGVVARKGFQKRPVKHGQLDFTEQIEGDIWLMAWADRRKLCYSSMTL